MFVVDRNQFFKITNVREHTCLSCLTYQNHALSWDIRHCGGRVQKQQLKDFLT